VTEPRPWRPERIVLGRIGRPHGLDGSVRLEGHGGAVPLSSGMDVEVAGEPARLESVKGTGDRPIVRLSLAGDRAGAEALRGRDVAIPAERLPEPAEDEWYHVDLVGCRAVAGGRDLGEVVDVLSYPANDVLVVRRGGAEDLLAPFVADVVLDVDVPGRRLVLSEEFAE
jgi:16S rRNA processing protein RimM